jgi:HAD domain in Swiss Army Knife RNA repair proteins
MAAVPSTPSERPQLFLDVDGVLNAFDLDPGGDVDTFDDFGLHEVEFEFEVGHPRTFVVCLSPAMGARLAQLAVDIHWVTTWEHRADSAIAPLCGLPSGLPVLSPLDEAEEWELDWKFLAVRRSVEGDPRPFVWIDDDIDYFRDGRMTARDWAAGTSLPNLLIAPESESGLLPDQLDAVEEFVRRHGGGVQDP